MEEIELPLPPEHELFCQEFALNHNRTQAILAAAITDNSHSASVMGSRLIRRPEIRARVKEIREEINDEYGNQREYVIAELSHLARGGDLAGYDEDGAPVPIPPSVRVAALTQLGRIVGIFEEDNMQQAKDTVWTFTRGPGVDDKDA